jgi:PII-like signaling protein
MTDTIKRLRIYTDEAAYFGDQKVFEVVALRARAAHVAGTTVFRALFGFGHTTHEHRRHVLDDDQSIVIEILDEESKLRAFVNSLSDLEHLGPVTLETIELLRWPKPDQAED